MQLIEREHTCVPGVHACVHVHTHAHTQVLKSRSSGNLQSLWEPGRYRRWGVGWGMQDAYRVSGDTGDQELWL